MGQFVDAGVVWVSPAALARGAGVVWVSPAALARHAGVVWVSQGPRLCQVACAVM